MPNGDPWDGFFDPTLTLMIDPYTLPMHFIEFIYDLLVFLQFMPISKTRQSCGTLKLLEDH